MRCELWRSATKTVFGEGTVRARAMLVGEQPGDAEDEQGRPFVGPAGVLLRNVLEEVGLRERDLYLTNAVKHFKWRAKGTRRLYDTPNWSEIRACGLWRRLDSRPSSPTSSAILRAGERRHERRAELVDDLTLVREQLASRRRGKAAARR